MVIGALCLGRRRSATDELGLAARDSMSGPESAAAARDAFAVTAAAVVR